jgi:hypothetical protein
MKEVKSSRLLPANFARESESLLHREVYFCVQKTEVMASTR